MTGQEVSKRYNIAESTLKNQFKRTQQRILKNYGVNIVKYGRGDKVYYLEEDLTDVRALTIFEEPKEILAINEQDISLDKWTFLIILAIAATPMCVFRGTYRDMLSYLCLNRTPAAIEALKSALILLEKNNVIIYKQDKSTAEDYFIAAFYRSIEKEANTSIRMIKMVKRLADDNNIHEWVTMFKVYTAIEQVAAAHQTFTLQEIGDMSGVSASTVVRYKKILETNEWIKTSKSFIAYNKCIGQTVDVNGFLGE